MKLFSNIFNRSGTNRGKKLAVTAAVFMALTGAGFVGISGLTGNKAFAGDCSPNSIINCGAASRAQFIADVKASPELQKIYAHFGLTSADYNRFITSAQSGVARRAQNDILVGNNVVATNVWSIGRQKSAQGNQTTVKTVAIAGAGTYFGNFNNQSFAANHPTIPVDVLFNAKGQMQFAVMTGTCGNPATGNIVTPTEACKTLQAKSLGNNNWSFTSEVTMSSGVKVTKLVYNFGDGKTATTTSPTTAVTHTFTKNSTVTVTVTFTLPGGGTITKDCTHQITFTPPPASFACTLLTLTPGKVDQQGNQAFTLAAKATATNATIKSYTFDFGDTAANKVVATSATSASTTHTYAAGTNTTASVTVTVLTNTGQTKTVGGTGNCAKPVSVKKLVSTLACISLDKTPGNIDQTTGDQQFSFKATASATNATVTSYIFTVDGVAQPAVTTANLDKTFAPGDHTVSVSVAGKDASGNAIAPVTSDNCKVSFTVNNLPKPGTLTCVSLTKTPGAVDDKGNQSFTFTAQASANNATITNYVFSFDGSAQPPVTTSATTATTSAQTFAPGTHDVSVTVNGTDNKNQPISATSQNCQITITPEQQQKNPNITLTKMIKTDSGLVKQLQVQVGQSYVYQIVIKNTGEIALTNAVVTDQPDSGITLLSADLGTVAADGTSWTYTIPSLAVGDSVTVNITAKVDATSDQSLVNTACVNAPEVNPTQPEENDVCDTATVTTPQVEAAAVNELVNTGTGSTVGLFVGATIIGTLGYRLFLSRRLNHQD